MTDHPKPPPRLWETLIAYREQQQRFEAQRRLVRAAAEAAEAERIREHGR
jgi:hypothetical protein